MVANLKKPMINDSKLPENSGESEILKDYSGRDYRTVWQEPRSLLGLVGDEALGGEHQRGDRRRVLQRRPRDLGGVDDAGLHQVDELTGRRVEPDGALRPRPGAR